MLSTNTALFYTVVLGAVIFLCRFLPFVIFGENINKEKINTEQKQNKMKAFLEFVEATVPAVAMTVLAVNALAAQSKEALTVQPPDLAGIIPLGSAALVTAVLHFWKRNALVSIFGGTALYMFLITII
ncbi:MAG: AzlD domain-containing protein [Treponema sp.]|nr:AzlD domain-containing protein [Treponema sp.]